MKALSRDLDKFAPSLNWCQSCGDDAELSLWQEHDEKDAPTPTLVTLCKTCADRIISAHPRLYGQVARHKPIPGAMFALCDICTHRVGHRCTSPDAKANGGAGIIVKAEPPVTAFVDGTDSRGRRCGGRRQFWRSPASHCSGRMTK